jgi:hypothetical protein
MRLLNLIKNKSLSEQIWLIFLIGYFTLSISAYILELFYVIATGKTMEQLAFYQFLHTYHNFIVMAAMLYSVIILLLGHKQVKRALKLSIEGHNELSKEVRENMDRAIEVRIKSRQTLNTSNERLAKARDILKEANKKLDEALKIEMKNNLNKLS